MIPIGLFNSRLKTEKAAIPEVKLTMAPEQVTNCVLIQVAYKKWLETSEFDSLPT